jgi:RNA polymerase-binding transcription factor DksA
MSFAEFNASLHGDVEDDADRASIRQFIDIETALQARQAIAPVAQLIVGGVVVCKGCEKPIPPERLQRHPDSACCVPCLSEIETKEKQGR